MDWFTLNSAEFFKNLLIFALILVIGHYVINFILMITRRALRKSQNCNAVLQNFTVNALHKVLWVILIMMALPRLGVNVGPMIAGLGVTGFIIGFACQETLGNLAAGVMLMIEQPFDVDQFVEVNGQAGIVKDINIMATMLNTPDNKRITIPNGKVWGNSIINYSAMPTRRVDMTFGIGYNANIGQAIETISTILSNNEKVMSDPAPTVAVVELADSSVNLVVRPWAATSDYWDVYFSTQRIVKETFDEQGITIPFPQIDIHLPDGPPLSAS